MPNSFLESIYKQLSEYINVSAVSLWLMNEHGFKKRASIGTEIDYNEELTFIRDTYVAPSVKIKDKCLGISLAGNFNLSIIIFIQASKNLTPEIAKIAKDVCSHYRYLTQEVTYHDETDDLSVSTSRAIAITNLLDQIKSCDDVLKDHNTIALIARTINNITQTLNLIIVHYDAAKDLVDACYYQDEFDESRFPFKVEQALVDGSVSAFIVKFGKTLRGNSEDIAMDLGVNPNQMYGTHASDLIGVPIKYGDQVFGAIIVQSYEKNSRFDEYVAATISSIANMLGNKVQNEESSKELNKIIQNRTNELREKNIVLTKTIDELKRTKENLVKSESQVYIADILWNIVHYLNTPISNAKSNLLITSSSLSGLIDDIEQLEKPVEPHVLQDILNNCYLSEASLGKASDVLNQINKLATRPSDVKIEEFSIDSLFEELKINFSEQLNEQDLQLEGKEFTQKVTGPKQIIMNVLTPLIQNSIDHCHLKVGSLKIKVAVEIAENKLKIEMQDNGIGIDESMKNHLFEPFSTSAALTGSLGLGLFTSHYLITQVLGGNIEIDHDSAEGVRFNVQIPLVQSTN
ncbi:MAG: hypothetical protein HWE27_13735 [Gammaproteobacteria bacterium]|nr:hypothetical protein [Gammaproteobacteria bacterium]